MSHLDLFELQPLSTNAAGPSTNLKPTNVSLALRASTSNIARDNISVTGSQSDPPNNNNNSAVVSKGQAIGIILQLTVIIGLNSITNGFITVGMPQIAVDVGMEADLVYWPALVASLTSGATLLLFGAIADVVTPRPLTLLGSLLLSITTLSCGLVRTGTSLIILRSLSGIALAMFLPTASGIISSAIPSGRLRNLGFACLGMGQCVGFALGLVLEGVFVSLAGGWRTGFYIVGGVGVGFAVAGWWLIPKGAGGQVRPSSDGTWKRLVQEVDWVGAGLASASMALLAFVLAMITVSSSYIRKASNISLLIISILLLPAFGFWIARQERLGKPALMPTSLWKNLAFTSVCLMVLLVWADGPTCEFMDSLFFQQVQQLSPLQSSIRFLPSVMLGAVLNLTTGALVDKVSVYWLLISTCLLSAGSPLLMAVIKPQWPYWYAAFPAQILLPVSGDVIYTIGLLIISDVFPANMQAVAGAVFNTVAQFGQAFGLAIIAVISSSVSQRQSEYAQDSPQGLLVGYRAGFWACFAFVLIAVTVGTFGLRRVGAVGLKRD